MTATKHDDEILPQITYGKVVTEIASHLLKAHGLPDTSQMFTEERAFNDLVAKCSFLPESMCFRAPYARLPNPDDSIAVIVDLVNADLQSSQLAILAQAVTSIATGYSPHVSSLPELLEHIWAGANNIDDAEDEAERRQLNQRAKTSISSAIAELEPIAHLLETIKEENSLIDSSDHPMVNESLNQEAQFIIIVKLEELDFTTRQDNWATAHGFQRS